MHNIWYSAERKLETTSSKIWKSANHQVTSLFHNSISQKKIETSRNPRTENVQVDIYKKEKWKNKPL